MGGIYTRRLMTGYERIWTDMDSPRVKMHPELIDVRCDIGTTHMRRQGGLFQAEHRSRQGSDALALQLATGLHPFPCRWDLNANPFGVVRRIQVLE